MGKGPSQITSTQVNPTAEAQRPFLLQGWNQARNLYENNPQNYTPNQTLAGNDPNQIQGYSNIYGTGKSLDASLRPDANKAFMDAATGQYGYQNSPATPYYNQFSSGASSPQQMLQDLAQRAMAAGGNAMSQIGGYAPTAAGYGSGAVSSAGQYAPTAAGYGSGAVSSAGQYAPTAAGYGAQAAAGGGGFQDQLAKTAAGDYLKADSNPYLQDYIKAAQDPTGRQFRDATAALDSDMVKAGRYGSGALVGQRDRLETNLGEALGKIGTDISYRNYGDERTRQTAAAQQGWDLRNRGLATGIQGAQTAADIANRGYQTGIQGAQSAADIANRGYQTGIQGAQSAADIANRGYQTGITGATNAADIANRGYQTGISGATSAADIQRNALNSMLSGYQQAGSFAGTDLSGRQTGAAGLASGYNAGNQAALEAMRNYPQFANAQYTAANNDIQAGAGMRSLEQQRLDDVNKRYYGEQNAPFEALDRYLKQIGQPQTGSETSTQPNFQNTGANALSAVTGIASAAKALGGLGAGGAGAAAAAPLAWIVCTELTRQGRMNKRHWAPGAREFVSYPEIFKRGYYVWAIPSVRHLRAKPDSLYSRFLGVVFRWRAEDIAARAGVRGARRLRRGWVVKWSLALPCLVLGAIVGPQEWEAVYRETGHDARA